MQREENNNVLTQCGATCELVDGRLGHAVSQHARELQEDKHRVRVNNVQTKNKKKCG